MALNERLETAYNSRRTMKTWGTKRTSHGFFRTVRDEGWGPAFRYQVEASRSIGNNPALRAAAAILGSTLLLTGIEKKAENAERNKFYLAPLTIASWGLVLSLLIYGCGENSTDTGSEMTGVPNSGSTLAYPGDGQIVTIHLTRKQSKQVEKRRVQNAKSGGSACGMGAAMDEFPELFDQ